MKNLSSTTIIQLPLLLLLLLLQHTGLTQAGLRFGCASVRVDPAAGPPGRAGGMQRRARNTEDLSNYWTAVLTRRTGPNRRVPQYANAELAHRGPRRVVKDLFGNGDQYITAFPPGFRMTVGSPTKNTNTIDDGANNPGLRYTCLDTVLTRGQETYETMWNTTAFDHMWPEDGSQPFVWSFGDGKGYGTHADYMFGWKGDSLQRAMNSSCMFHACGSPGAQGGILETQTVEEMNRCHVESTVVEDIDGWLDHLPGQEMPM
ncbi:hypothetical protein F5Y17DRAFT_463706 [Xylariaceae sp. FL0594]|nr:hypothetical protein F5Y17DRAFT_463706 [Xylariaceae sp. FL0594]